jgi:hypothetical protein
MTFERHIVWPDGRKEIEGVTPKALPAPSHVLPKDQPTVGSTSDINHVECHRPISSKNDYFCC